MYKKTYSSKDVIMSLNLYERLKSFRKTSMLCGISKSTIHRWWGSLHCLRKRTKFQRKKTLRQSRFSNLKNSLQAMFSDNALKFYTLKQIRDAIKDTKPSISTIHRVLKTIKVSRRRFDTHKVCPRSAEEMKQRYLKFSEQIRNLQDDEIVCVDETYLCNIGNQSYGYFKKGMYPRTVNVPKRKKYSIIMAVSSTEVVSLHKQTKAFNKDTFNNFIIGNLLPLLSPKIKALIMDNVAFHKNNNLIKNLSNKGINCVFIPPYSPRCNPIEEVFSVLKRRFRTYDNDLDFEIKVDKSIQEMQLYKDIQCFYKHSRDHVSCHLSEL